jgi:hypothetical protein
MKEELMDIMSLGNLKLPKTTAIFNLPSGKTCPGKTRYCKEVCYARKAERLYKQVPRFRMQNYLLSLTDEFVRVIKEELDRKKVKTVRIHESGDCYSQEYYNKWIRIAMNRPDITFYAYTKSFDLDYYSTPNNLILWASLDHSTKPEEKDKAVKLIKEGLFAGWTYIENKGEREPGGALVCPGDCSVCDNCYRKTGGRKNVWFKKH